MAVNKYIPHLFVIPEDDANRQMAIGFEKDDRIRARSLQIVAPAGGWSKALEKLKGEYYRVLESNPNSHVLVIIDCDQDSQRIPCALAKVPGHLQNRVFIIGTLSEPEELRKSLNGTLEMIGESVAQECYDPNQLIWKHDQLQHNSTEVIRLKSVLFPVVFDA